MEGVILFADDKVFEPNSSENRLYLKLAKEYPVLAVETISLADVAIKSIGTFSAIILDWEFKVTIDNTLLTQHPTVILDNSDFYSLIYIFSNGDLPTTLKTKYRKMFKDRIVFKRKNTSGTINQRTTRNHSSIKADITNWHNRNQNQSVPLKWSNSINKSVQHIFAHLSKADPNWIFELYKSATGEVNPEIEVISLLQSLLSERLFIDQDLRQTIKTLVQNPTANATTAGLATLFQKIYYTKLTEFDFSTVPIMTGDIFKLNDHNSEFGIIVTPECDIKKVLANSSQFFQILKFKKGDFAEHISKTIKGNKEAPTLNAKERIKAADLFNQPSEKLFFLPSFPFKKKEVDYPIVIDFSNSLKHLKLSQIQGKTRVCKLNMPFIQQLRQKYLSYIGRVGVPTMPDGLRKVNISHF